jgi:hypothetical protein
MSKLLPKLMPLSRAGSKSDRAYIETVRHIDMITLGIELLQTTKSTADEMESGDLHENGDDERGIVRVPPTHESGENTMEPSLSSTKGRKSISAAKSSKNSMIPDNPYIT